MSKHSSSLDHDLYKGMLDIVVLSLLSSEPHHGYGICVKLREQSESLIDISEGAVYPLLHRLEKKGLIDAEWTRSENNRRIKSYVITTQGQAVLEERSKQWVSLRDVVDGLIARINLGQDLTPEVG